jgi:hypothetical protein
MISLQNDVLLGNRDFWPMLTVVRPSYRKLQDHIFSHYKICLSY